jgi:uncharacterized protein YecA (UPF0149 family)
MNRKIMKQINRQVEKISLQWLHSLMSEEQAAQITAENYKDFMKMNSHYFAEGQFFMSAFTEKWTRKRLKKLYTLNPSKPIDSYTHLDLS